jgi:phenylalanyl-tRNA synthetase beta chain
MFDLSNPMHAFDAAFLPNKTIVARFARNKEKLTLLDGETVGLTAEDFVITDGQDPIALAGVMGGKSTGVSLTTTTLFVEAANFDAGTIRKSAQRVKKRTEASARFEKNLDPNLNTQALTRFLKMLELEQIPHSILGSIVSLGNPVQEQALTISHEFLERRLGVSVSIDFTHDILCKLGFGVQFSDGIYQVMVPTIRSTKDVTIKEDIVEEVGRFFGYTNIPLHMPYKPTDLANVHPIMRVRTIKQTIASALAMREVYNYSFFDEDFFNVFPWHPGPALTVQNPVSENWRRLVTTLIPNLFKNIQQAAADHDSIRFFEWARTWRKDQTVQEKRSLAGIFFEQHAPVDFYEAKAMLTTLLSMLHLEVEWAKVDSPEFPWFAPFQTAYLLHEGTKIGIAGKAQPAFLQQLVQGDAFIFELDGDFLLNYKQPLKKFVPISKYPEVIRDVSMLVPLAVTANMVVKIIEQADPKIVSSVLMDFFEKPEWVNQRSYTFRFIIRDTEKTLTKPEVDLIADSVNAALQRIGAVIR